VLVTAPLLLSIADMQRRHTVLVLARRGETYLQAAVMAATVWLVFWGFAGDPAHHFFLLFLPLIWIAVRSGMAGAVLATGIVQLGVVLGIHHKPAGALPIVELQAFVAALTMTALYLGVMVDERARATEGLKQSLRLAAAGEMAAAIAHEVNQPLTALNNYGRSGQMLIEAGRTAELGPVIGKMLGEAQRAAEVVRRLRDFFREGTTRLEPMGANELLETARKIALGFRQAPGVCVRVQPAPEPALPPVFADRLQLELVLRNLIANAVEAVQARTDAERRVTVWAERHDRQHLRLVVQDSGPGLSGPMRKRAFEAFVSGKPSGMGLGLAVSRAIAEAHGGSLELAPAAHGEFHLVLPFKDGHV
jgi:signal transduction histidine kinase